MSFDFLDGRASVRVGLVSYEISILDPSLDDLESVDAVHEGLALALVELDSDAAFGTPRVAFQAHIELIGASAETIIAELAPSKGGDSSVRLVPDAVGYRVSVRTGTDDSAGGRMVLTPSLYVPSGIFVDSYFEYAEREWEGSSETLSRLSREDLRDVLLSLGLELLEPKQS